MTINASDIDEGLVPQGKLSSQLNAVCVSPDIWIIIILACTWMH